MKNLCGMFVIIFAFLLQSCVSDINALRLKEKFSPFKKYAVIPFNCPDKNVGGDFAESLRNWLVTFGYDIIDSTSVTQLFAKNKLNIDDVIKNYTCALGKIKEVDGFIIGYIYFDQKSARTGNILTSHASTGGYRNFVDKCDVLVVDLNSGDIEASANYTGDVNASLSASSQAEEIGRILAKKLSPH